MCGQGFLADSYGLASIKASVNIDVRRDFLAISRGFKDRDGGRDMGQIGPRLRELLFVIRN